MQTHRNGNFFELGDLSKTSWIRHGLGLEESPEVENVLRVESLSIVHTISMKRVGGFESTFLV